MALETELKLHISPEHLNKLKRHPFLRSISMGRARTQKLYSIYYDTPGLDLRRHAMALRLRKAGRHWIQTLKGAGQMSAGLHQRNEWEAPVASDQLDFGALRHSGGRLPRGTEESLQPVFVTDFARNLRLVEFGGASIELAMDSGEIRAGKASHPISEIELELKSGDPLQLFRLALALLDVVPMTVEQTNKAEYGYMLFAASRPSVAKARFPTLEKSQPVTGALREVIAACLAHVQANVPGALQKVDEEFLHQVRVGLRRLRVALAVARRIHPDAELAALHGQVTRLCVELGRARDWDVFVTQILPKASGRLSAASRHDLLRAGERARERQHADMVGILSSQDYQRMLLHFGEWLLGSPAAKSKLTLRRLADKTIDKRYRQVVKHGKKKSAAKDTKRLHLLRIACKKLRYSIEVFATLFDERESGNYLRALAKMQDVLGALNDIVMVHRLLDELENASRHAAIALVRSSLEDERAENAAAFDKAWKRFAAQAPFWVKASD